MKLTLDHIVSFCVRSFCTALFALIGLAFGGCILLLFITLFTSEVPIRNVSSKYSVEVLAGPDGTRESLSFYKPVILQINIHGALGSEHLNGAMIREMLLESREGYLEGDRVKAILLHINSPGGTASASDEVYRALMEYRWYFDVPIYAYVENMCASGGYYVACAADGIYTSDTALIGSIGVYIQFFNVVEFLNKVGVEAFSISNGIGKDDMNPFHVWGDAEKSRMQAIEKKFYDKFVNLVVKARPKIDRQKLIEEYGAQVFFPEQAADYGFIDGYDLERSDVIRGLAEVAGLSEGFQVVTLNQKNWLSSLFNSESSLLSGKHVHEVRLPAGLSVEFANQYLYMYQPGFAF
jgi:signal peptide peptidase SppA